MVWRGMGAFPPAQGTAAATSFHVRGNPSTHFEERQALAQEILKPARYRTPDESVKDLDEALRLADAVQGSPLYNPEAASTGKAAKGAST
jgi:hypothetical protein